VTTDFDFSVEQRPGEIDVRVHGDLDMNGVFRLEPALDALGDDLDETHVRIDLRPATFIDSSGMGLLVNAYERLAQHGAEVSFIPGSPEVMRPFELSGLTGSLPFGERDG
jgi:anti-sigma B factor antagonist